MMLRNRFDAYELMAELDAPQHLVEHVQLVWEAGQILCAKFQDMDLDLDYSLIEIGIAVHDIGKTTHTNELSGSGSEHEAEGQRLLQSRGIANEIARICVSHSQWNDMKCSTEELIVALSDKLWKGKRVEALELQVIDRISSRMNVDRWEIFTDLDSCFEQIAADGQQRLNRSVSN